RMARYEAAVGPLALNASHAALAEAGVAPGAITHLVTVSCTGFAAPGFDVQVIKGLGLDPSVQRTHVGFMGCHGALNGLRVARAVVASEPGACVLLCAAELCSLHFTFGPGSERSVCNALFADGAAAVVAARGGDDRPGAWSLAANGSVLTPGTEDAMTWRVGDRGFAMTLAPEVPKLIRDHLRPWLTGWLQRQGVALDGVGSWAVHPGGPKGLDVGQGAPGVGPPAPGGSPGGPARHGHPSAA